MERNYKATILLITGWGLFLLCLLLPALIVREDLYSGFTAGTLAVFSIFDFKLELEWLQISISGVGNIISIFIILSTAVSNKRYMIINTILFTVFALVSLIYSYQYRTLTLGSGYYIWVISLFIISYAHFITYKSLTKRSSGTSNP